MNIKDSFYDLEADLSTLGGQTAIKTIYDQFDKAAKLWSKSQHEIEQDADECLRQVSSGDETVENVCQMAQIGQDTMDRFGEVRDGMDLREVGQYNICNLVILRMVRTHVKWVKTLLSISMMLQMAWTNVQDHIGFINDQEPQGNTDIFDDFEDFDFKVFLTCLTVKVAGQDNFDRKTYSMILKLAKVRSTI